MLKPVKTKLNLNTLRKALVYKELRVLRQYASLILKCIDIVCNEYKSSALS